MKCVCPMGGDRTCPDECPLAMWAGLSTEDRKAKRKPIAERLYKLGFTMEQIATQLGVSKATISGDLVNCLTTEQSKPAKTTSNPKGAGRPKGSKQRKSKPRQTDPVKDKIVALADQGVTSPRIAAEVGVDGRAVRHELERERHRREGKADPEIERSVLSMSAQEKLDAAVRQHQRKLDLQFEERVHAEVKSRIDEMILPHWKKQIAEAKRLYDRRRGLMTKEAFNTIRRALHPDSRLSISDNKLGAAFDAFMGLEKFLLDEKDSPTNPGAGLPSTMAEWDRMRAAATAERRAKRTKMTNPVGGRA